MFNKQQTMSQLRILITNDDNVHSNGIKALERIANSISPDVWVVAPEVGQSGKSFSVTFDDILRIRELSPRKFSVSGTPTDCVFVAIGEILKDKKPDLVLSGINHGSNIADFIGLSGTVGAVFAAASRDIMGIAVSQHCSHSDIVKFPIADLFLPSIIKKIMSCKWPDHVCMNVNFPDVPLGEVRGVRVARQGKADIKWEVHKKLDPMGDSYYWLHAVYSDLNGPAADLRLVTKEKSVTITPLLCRHEFPGCFDKLEELFSTNA
ncbi:MAG: 5'/3'-nucleotidase SurE [Holosporaceae bacterium]|jgi:5'-nucleotidase|nr:5'/3'-nucleotidase SurE [Holosporaceae bacterium]